MESAPKLGREAGPEQGMERDLVQGTEALVCWATKVSRSSEGLHTSLAWILLACLFSMTCCS
jgi:hypothetical protein